MEENKTNQNGLKYFRKLPDENKQIYLDKLKKVKQVYRDEEKRPNYMKILDSEMTESNKSTILQKINTILLGLLLVESSAEASIHLCEYFSLHIWQLPYCM